MASQRAPAHRVAVALVLCVAAAALLCAAVSHSGRVELRGEDALLPSQEKAEVAAEQGLDHFWKSLDAKAPQAPKYVSAAATAKRAAATAKWAAATKQAAATAKRVRSYKAARFAAGKRVRSYKAARFAAGDGTAYEANKAAHDSALAPPSSSPPSSSSSSIAAS
ncbi:hypothetical protein T484DRAFT_1836818, partial [Baffinella frigidus]